MKNNKMSQYNQPIKLRDQAQQTTQYLQAMSSQLEHLVAKVAYMGETLSALVVLSGEDVVAAKMDELRTKRRIDHETKLEESVQFLLDKGLATLSEDGALIGPNSFVVGREVLPDGKSIRVQHEIMRLDQAGQARYIGKKVGDEVTLPGVSAKVIIDRIYTIDLVKVQQFAAEKRSTQTADTTPPV